jgi:hypothetical protein
VLLIALSTCSSTGKSVFDFSLTRWNRGSDHPAILEAVIRAKQGAAQPRSFGSAKAHSMTENSTKVPEIITCPSELVALSAALGYAQVTGIPV